MSALQELGAMLFGLWLVALVAYGLDKKQLSHIE